MQIRDGGMLALFIPDNKNEYVPMPVFSRMYAKAAHMYKWTQYILYNLKIMLISYEKTLVVLKYPQQQ